ncbi:MAG: DUF370 domain-containing protein [Oscillospiraceae bacterium]|nr:DUF370 domain-containing protein [Oscillospiraceae bacterium]
MNYLYLGQGQSVPQTDIVGVFDLDNTTVSKHTRGFLNNSQKQNQIESLNGAELPKSFVLCTQNGESRVKICRYSSKILFNRV